MRIVKLRSLAIGPLAAAAMLGAAVPVSAQSSAGAPGGSTSGTPGGLGTEVPLDSKPARDYFNYSLPTDTAEARRVQDGIQRLHADFQAVMRAASLAEGDPGASADAKQSADELKEDAQRNDWKLLDVAQNGERMNPSGPGYETRLHELRSQRNAGSSGSSASSAGSTLSDAAQLSRTASSDADALEKQARKDSRQQLASILDGARKTFDSDASKVASAAGTSSTGTGSGQ